MATTERIPAYGPGGEVDFAKPLPPFQSHLPFALCHADTHELPPPPLAS